MAPSRHQRRDKLDEGYKHPPRRGVVVTTCHRPHSSSWVYLCCVRCPVKSWTWRNLVLVNAAIDILSLYHRSHVFDGHAGTYSGAVFLSIDAGEHWTPVIDRRPVAASINVIATAARAVSPVYAGGSNGIFQSNDQGANWEVLTVGRSIAVSPFVVDPSAPATIFAVVDGGVRGRRRGRSRTDVDWLSVSQ